MSRKVIRRSCEQFTLTDDTEIYALMTELYEKTSYIVEK